MLLIRFISILLLFSPGTLPAQVASPAEAIYHAAKKKIIPKYSTDSRYEHLQLGSAFSRDTIQKIQYTDRRIIKIDLVYTAFRESPDFSQEELNIRRLENFIQINPAILSNSFIDWHLVEQTGCNSSSTCSDFYHGFVIYYDTYYTKKETISEIDSIREDLKLLETTINQNQPLLEFSTNPIDCDYPAMLYSEEYVSEELEKIYSCSEKFKGIAYFTAIMDYKGRTLDVAIRGSLAPCQDRLAGALKYILQWKHGLIVGRLQYGLTVSGRVNFPLNKQSVEITRYSIADSLVDRYKILAQNTRCTAYQVDTAFTRLIPEVTKKAVSNVLFRNDWEEKLIVVDVTGSMFPYTADLLKWIRLGALQEEKTFVFFNDGNDKPTHLKKIGNTGGLYLVRTEHFTEVRETMFEAMRNGGGGDLRENNCEALLYGIRKSGYPNSAIMIADNYSFPRDYQLLNTYGGNLKIILCGTEKGINTDYLDLAKKNGYTLHTLETDIRDLASIRTGQKITLEGIEYVYTNRGFSRTTYTQ